MLGTQYPESDKLLLTVVSREARSNQARCNMRNAWRALTVAAMAVVIAAAARPAHADSFDSARWVTSGSYFTQGGQDFFSFVGSTFEFHATSGATPDKVFPPTCSSCMPGDTVNLGHRSPPFDANGVFQFVDLGTGHGHVLDNPDEGLAFSGSLKFMATPTMFPDVTSSTVTLTTPLYFRGWLNGTFTTGPNAGSGGYGIRLKAFGTASQTFMREGDAYRAIGDPTYTFAATTPEPGSLLLLGTGIAAIGRRLRKKR